MCGIAALYLTNPHAWAEPVMGKMLTLQTHRGPDARGTYRDPNGTVFLGHNRLSIIDLSEAGNQPLANEDENIWLVANGEIYNHAELRRELEVKGHRFRSRSDSEIILHLYEEHGADLLSRLRGMFAFVLFDQRTGELLCARDPVGKKPLVYGETSHGFVAASEIPAALTFPGIDRGIEQKALAFYLLRNLRHVPDPLTFYKGLRRLQPGHAMLVRDGMVQRTWRYWRPTHKKREVCVEEVLEVLDRAVQRRLVADTEIAALLSGGVDSTAIVHSAWLQGTKDMRTYALGRDANDDELVRARRAAKLLGTRHREFYFDPDRQHELMIELLRIHGEPIAILPLVHAYEICRHVRSDGIKVVLAGHGADEIFYGYTGFLGLAALSRLIALTPSAIAPVARWVAPWFPPGSRLREGLLVAGAPAGRRKAMLYMDEAERIWPELLSSGSEAKVLREELAEWLGVWMAELPPNDYIDEAAILGLMHENAHSVTIAGDLAGMAASVEVRCPFLDQDLVELAWCVPFTRKVGSLRDDGRLKYVLKQALSARLPDDLLYAPKRGFGYNIQERDVLAGPWRDRVDTELDRMGDLGGLLNLRGVAELRQGFRTAPDSGKAMMLSKLYSIALTTVMAA